MASILSGDIQNIDWSYKVKEKGNIKADTTDAQNTYPSICNILQYICSKMNVCGIVM